MTSNRKTGRAEKGVIIVVVTVIIVIGTVIFISQFDYNQAVIEISRASLNKRGGAAVSEGPLIKPSEGLVPLSEPETFTPETLYEKINGQAELYLSAGFKGLRAQRFSETDNPEAWLEVFVYDMGNGSNAYSVFSAQRRRDAIPLEVGQFAYRTENAVFMAHGRYYLELIAFVPTEKLFESVETMAEIFARDTPIEETSIAGLDWFPKEGLDGESLTLVASDAFGFERLDQVYTAEYKMNGNMLTAFVSKRSSHDEAVRLVTAFHGFLQEFGGKDQKTELTLRGIKVIEIMGTHDVVFSRGPFFAGVHEAPDKETAEQLALKLDAGLREIVSAREDGG